MNRIATRIGIDVRFILLCKNKKDKYTEGVLTGFIQCAYEINVISMEEFNFLSKCVAYATEILSKEHEC